MKTRSKKVLLPLAFALWFGPIVFGFVYYGIATRVDLTRDWGYLGWCLAFGLGAAWVFKRAL